MKIYNSKSREIEVFEPLHEGKVSMYVCGPTVYDQAHLGHARSAISFDVIRKYLEYRGYDVKYVSNYTDIDDKMINRAAELEITVPELADKIIADYESVMEKLDVAKPDVLPKATDYIEKIIEILKVLEKKDVAYVIEGTGLYFDITKFKDYGVLKQQNLDDLEMGARVDVDENKRNPQDFVLWKFEKPGEPAWDSPWGRGRPGWHIECTAMIKQIFEGETIDIHGGGSDLKFPHHDSEIAQAQCYDNKEYVKYWLHNGFVMVDDKKMSKSLGNFSTLESLLKTYSAETIRFYCLQGHYRAPLNFHDDALNQAAASQAKIKHLWQDLSECTLEPSQLSEGVKLLCEDLIIDFEEFMDDDFEIAPFLAKLYEFVKVVNKGLRTISLKSEDKKEVLRTLEKINGVLGIFKMEKFSDKEHDRLEKLVKERDEARANRDFAKSDQMRDAIESEFGVLLLDRPDGPTTWRKV